MEGVAPTAMPVRLHLTVVLSLDCCPDERACWMDIVAGCSDVLLPASEEAPRHAQVGQSDTASEGHHHTSTGNQDELRLGGHGHRASKQRQHHQHRGCST